MDIKALDKALQEIVKKREELAKIDYNNPKYDDLEEQLIKSLSEYHHLIEPNSYLLRVVHIRKDYIAFKFQYNLVQFTREMERQIKRKCIRSVVKIIYQGKSR